MPLPGTQTFEDEDGIDRREMRIRWWEDPSKMTYEKISVLQYDNLLTEQVDMDLLKDSDFYKKDDKPVFFGHYWIKERQPALFKDNICCLDYSVAKGGKLVAFSLDDEFCITKGKFTAV